MLKILKLHNLRKEREAHLNAAIFCTKKTGQMFRNKEYMTDEGERRWQNYMRRFNVHMDT